MIWTSAFEQKSEGRYTVTSLKETPKVEGAEILICIYMTCAVTSYNVLCQFSFPGSVVSVAAVVGVSSCYRANVGRLIRTELVGAEHPLVLINFSVTGLMKKSLHLCGLRTSG